MSGYDAGSSGRRPRSLRRQPRRSAWPVLVCVVALVAGCTGDPKKSGPTPTDDPVVAGGEVIDRFAQAWGDPNLGVSTFRGMVDAPGVAARDISAHVAELGVTSTQVKPSGDIDCDDDSCREHAEVTHSLAGVGEWSYSTLVQSQLNQGQWLVTWSPGTFHPDVTEVTTLTRRRIVPPRAPILDRNGAALTPEREIVRVGIEAGKERPGTYARLQGLLDIDPAALRERVVAAKPGWFVSVIDLRRRDYAPLRADLLRVPGISVDTATRALAPTAEWGRALLGTVGVATEDALENAGPYALSSDEVGLSGLQYAYQQRLAGTPGVSIALVEKSSGNVLNQILSRRPLPGEPLETSLDLQVQNAAEQAVGGVADTTAVVVVKASTGEVLAAANGPGATSYNTAFVGRYAPGSTFKTVSAAALLASGQVTTRTPVQCPDTTVVGGKRFKNYERGITGARPTFADAYAASCNTTVVEYADELTGEQLAKTGREFGFGEEWDLGLDGFSGDVPADADLVTRAADMIGQGKVVASPLMMALVAAAVDSGVSRTPTLLPGEKPGRRLTELDASLVTDLQSMMRRVVTDGTGQTVDLPGLPVHAKTGTAEFDLGGGRETGTNAWMIGYRGDLAFAVLVENGTSGAHDAAPVVREVLRALPASAYR